MRGATAAGTMNAATAWTPHGFADYGRFYPATPGIACGARGDATVPFIAAWDAWDVPQERGPRIDAAVTFVFVRGLFGRWIPGHFAAPLRALREAGAHAFVARSRAAGTVAINARLLAADIRQRAPGTGQLIFLCHSKGGLDLLHSLRQAPDLQHRAAAVVLCQSPRDGCAVLESVLLREHRDSLRASSQRFSEAAARIALIASGSRPGCLELTGTTLAAHIDDLDRVAGSLPTLAVASWSVEPSAWLDSQHARLGAIRPNCAHDGLFFLEDLVWPTTRAVLLPRIDHSQPCVGGLNFPHGRFWHALATVAVAESQL